jgi:hypothetical protein
MQSIPICIQPFFHKVNMSCHNKAFNLAEGKIIQFYLPTSQAKAHLQADYNHDIVIHQISME